MGVYERDWVEDAEKESAAAINGVDVNSYTKKVGIAIYNYIEDNFNVKITKADWIGSESYEEPGDIAVSTECGLQIPVEEKFSKKNGSGTKANPSTNILKKYLKNNILNYPDFDKELGLKDKRYRLVENRIGRDLKNASDYENVLHQIRDIEKDTNFINEIVEITHPGKVKYANYVTEKLNDELDATQNLVDNILGGNHTTKENVEHEDVVYCVIKNFERPKQTVEFYDFSEMDSNVASVVSSGQSIKIQNKYGKDILRFSVNWKNICQGGGTPCFCVFVGNAFKT